MLPPKQSAEVLVKMFRKKYIANLDGLFDVPHGKQIRIISDERSKNLPLKRIRVLEFINEIQVFIIKLSTIIADYNNTHDVDFHKTFPALEEKLEYLRRLKQQAGENGGLPIWNARDNDLFNDIPAFFQEGLLMERDSHGNFQFSQVETEKVLLGLVQRRLGPFTVHEGHEGEVRIQNGLVLHVPLEEERNLRSGHGGVRGRTQARLFGVGPTDAGTTLEAQHGRRAGRHQGPRAPPWCGLRG